MIEPKEHRLVIDQNNDDDYQSAHDLFENLTDKEIKLNFIAKFMNLMIFHWCCITGYTIFVNKQSQDN